MIPIYFLSLFKIPSSDALRIEKLQQDFLWLGFRESKRDHLVSWDLVCKNKGAGGLGWEKILVRSRALLGKWLWKFTEERDTLWHQVILSIYRTLVPQ